MDIDALKNQIFEGASTMEEVLCLATLVAVGELEPTRDFTPTVADADAWNEHRNDSDCDFCKYREKCLTSLI